MTSFFLNSRKKTNLKTLTPKGVFIGFLNWPLVKSLSHLI